MKTKRTQIIGRILSLSFQKPILMSISVILAVISALSYFVPYLSIYRLLYALLVQRSNIISVQVLQIGITACIGASVNVLTYFASLMLSHIAAFQTSFALRIGFAEKLSQLPMGLLQEIGSGKQFCLMGEGIDKIQSFIAHKLPDLVSSVVYPIATVILILSIDWRYGLALLAGILAAYVFHYMSMGRGGSKRMMDLYYTALEDMENAAVECVRGITVLKLFGFKSTAFQRLQNSIGDYTNMVIPYTKNWNKNMCWFFALIGNLYLFLLPVAAASLPNTGEYAPYAANLVFYLILSPSLASVIPKIGNIMEEFMRVNAEAESLDGMMHKEDLQQGHEPITHQIPSVQFSGVSFSYSRDSTQALSDVSFEVPAHTVTAIVGPSGSGKSSIVSLLARFWEPDAGCISLGGTDIRNISTAQLMNQISFVLQNDRCFSQSILENIRFGNKNASMDDVIEAAKAANCHEFILRLPLKYQTVLGDSGLQLSVGQQQRIMLARAILKNAPILVLDEATASQDAENEALIQQGLARLARGKTVVMIAHRLSTVQNAEQILVMNQGKIVQRGTHDALMQEGGLYAALWKAYIQTQAWRIEKGETTE